MLKELVWICKASVLAVEICFHHPTGSAAAASDVEGGTLAYDVADQFADVRPADGVGGICDSRLHQVDGLTDQEHLGVVAGIHRRSGVQERQSRPRRIVRTSGANEHQSCHLRYLPLDSLVAHAPPLAATRVGMG